MPVKRTTAMMGLVVAVGSASGCQVEKPLLVSCTTDKDRVDVVGLDPLRGRATLLSVSPPLTGTAHASPTEYEVLFQPGPDGASRLLLKINRYTYRVTREEGAPAAQSGAGTTGSSTGTCERYKAKPL
jgi:hypothetical protein